MTDFRSAPGVFTGNSITSRQVLQDPTRAEYDPTLRNIDGNLSRDASNSPVGLLRAGKLLGKVTATGKLRPSVIGLLTGAVVAGTVTSLTVSAVTATEVARLIALAGGNITLKVQGPPTAGGTMASTTVTVTAAAGTTLTITSATLPAYVIGSMITPTDGSEAALTVITQQFGIDVVATDGSSIDQPIKLFLRKAALITASIVDYSSMDASVKAAIKTALKAVGLFTFDDDR